jgi:DNA repair exonuclease SbcCD nuclease subunit
VTRTSQGIAEFVHLGDAHMGPNGRNPDRWRAVDGIIAENIDRPALAAWLIPGDLNHARMTVEDRNAWADRLRQMASRAPVFVCYGNHDLPGDLDIFAKLAATWPIYVVTTPLVVPVTLATGDPASVFVLPYPTEAGLVSRGVAPGQLLPTARQMLESIFMEAGGELEAARARGEITLAIGHVNIAGSITSSGQPNIGHEIEIDEALLTRLGPCYIGLNHIHKRQRRYAGSICRLDWGEIEDKGYLRATYTRATDAHIAKGHPAWEFVAEQFCPIAVAPMHHVEGSLDRDGFVYEYPDKPETWAGCEVRVRAHYREAQRSLLDFAKAHIYAEFAGAARFELELVLVRESALRAPAVAAAKTMPEKIEAWARETGTVLPEAVIRHLAIVEHGDLTVLVAEEKELMDSLLEEPTEAEDVELTEVA